MPKEFNMRQMAIIFWGLVIIGLMGCQQNPVDKNVADTATRNSVVTDDGFKVVLQEGLPEDVLDYTEVEYEAMLGIATRSVDGVEVYPFAIEDIVLSSDVVLVDYPNFEDLSEQDLEQIRSDFPELSDDDILNNLERIQEIYYSQATYECVQELSEGPATRYLGNDSLSRQEFWLLVKKFWLAAGVKKATDEAKALTNEKMSSWVTNKWGGATYKKVNGKVVARVAWNSEGDAFRHALWNALIAKHNGPSFNKVSKAVAWAKEFTDTHEKYGQKSILALETPMDYHNNEFGRDYFSRVAWTKKTGWWIFKKTKVYSPSSESIANALYKEAIKSTYVTSESQINRASGLVHIVD